MVLERSVQNPKLLLRIGILKWKIRNFGSRSWKPSKNGSRSGSYLLSADLHKENITILSSFGYKWFYFVNIRSFKIN